MVYKYGWLYIPYAAKVVYKYGWLYIPYAAKVLEIKKGLTYCVLKLNSDTSEDLLFCTFVLQETFGTIGDPATAMRDPMFYRWHSFVDDIFQEHKSTLPRYDVNKVSDRDCCIIIDTYSGSTSFGIQDDCRWFQDCSSIYPICAYSLSVFSSNILFKF